MTMKRSEPSIGDMLRKVNSTDWVWQVVEFVTPAGHRPHARLMRVNYPSDTRMFAVAALKDRKLFVNAAEPKPVTPARIPLQWESQQEA